MKPLVFLAALFLSVPQERREAPVRGNLNRTGAYSSDGLDKKPRLLWSFKSEGKGKCGSTPVLAGGALYAGARDGNVYSLDARTGKLLWKFKTGKEINTSPAVGDGKVYSFSGDGNLYALDAGTGKEVWRFDEGAGRYRRVPTYSGGLVFIGSAGDSSFWALEAKTGKVVWKVSLASGAIGTPAVSDGKIYVVTGNGWLYVLEVETGAESWKHRVGNSSPSSVALSENIVYRAASDRHLYAMDATSGEVKWKTHLSRALRPMSPAFSNGTVFVSGSGRFSYAVQAQTGKIVWEHEATNEVKFDPVIAGTTIIFGDERGRLYGVNTTTGKEKWTWNEIEAEFEGMSGAIAGGVLCVWDEDGSVLALQ